MMTDWKEGEKLLLLAQFDMREKITVAEKKEFHNNSYCAKPWICPLGVSGTKVSFPLRQKTLRIVEVYFYSELIASDIIRLEEKELFFGLSSGGVPLFYHGKWRIFTSREAARSCRTAGRKNNNKLLLLFWMLLPLCLVISNNFYKFHYFPLIFHYFN